VTPDERRAIGDPPVGKGLLGVNIYEGEAVRVRDMGHDRRAAGFPHNHPPMTSLLGVPVVSKGVIVGNLYLTDKASGAEFSETDEEMVKLFAAHAGAAVENTRLEEKLRNLAVVQERDRIAMDLHDGIIQSMYAVGLKLEGAGEDTATDPDGARATIDEAIEDLTKVIRDVRNYILELRPAHLGDDLGESLRALAAEFRAHSLIDTAVDVSPLLPVLRYEQRSAVFHIAQEALSNARKHSQATRVSIELHAPDGVVRLDVRDNGDGFDVSRERPEHHRGVGNMAARATSIDGTLTIESASGQGTLVRLELPITPRTEEQA
jgi:signal transduction histidine kinase